MHIPKIPSGETAIHLFAAKMRLSNSWARSGQRKMDTGCGKNYLHLRRTRYGFWDLLEAACWWDVHRLQYSSGMSFMMRKVSGGDAMDLKIGRLRKMEGWGRDRWVGMMLRLEMRRGGLKRGWMWMKLRFRKSIGEVKWWCVGCGCGCGCYWLLEILTKYE